MPVQNPFGNNILQSIASNFAAAAEGAILTKQGSAIVYALPSNNIAAMASPATVTNSATETVLWSFTVPGGTLNTIGHYLEILQDWSFTANTNQKQMRIRVGSGITGTVLQQVATTGGTNLAATPNRRLIYKSASLLRTNAITANSPDGGPGTAAQIEVAIDWTQDQIFSITGQNQFVNTNVLTLESAIVRVFR